MPSRSRQHGVSDMTLAMNKAAMKHCIQAVPLFAGVAESQMDLLVADSRLVAFKKGARIFEEGTAAECCYVLTEGKARVVLAGSRGTEILLQILVPAALVGELALLDGSTRSASLIAAEACQLIRISAAAFGRLRQDAAFEQRLVAGLLALMRAADDRVRVISSFPSAQRVAWCLGRIARLSGRRDDSAIVIPKPPHNELAQMAGCTRETVSRTLNLLQRKKYLSWDHDQMRIDVIAMQRLLNTELEVPNQSKPRPGLS